MDRRRMTILQVLPALESGGVERGVLEIAQAVVSAGHRSLVVSSGGRLVKQLTEQGTEHFYCPLGIKSPLTLRWSFWLRRFLQEQRVDLVDIHSRVPGWVTWLAWKSLPATSRPRLISTVHGLHSVSRFSSIMCCGELVIVVSDSVRDYVRQNYPQVPEQRLRLVPRGIEGTEFPRGFQPTDAWKQSFLESYPELRGRTWVTLAGRVTRLKGHPDFLKVLASLRERGLNVHGLIVGDADPRRKGYQAELRRLISTLQLEDRVTWTGYRQDMLQIYASSQIVTSFSAAPESFGRTVAEALSVGTPVIAYDHGGVREILSAQFPEGLIPAGDVATAVQRAEAILSDPDAFRRIGPNPFEKSDMLRGTLDVYDELLAERSGAAKALLRSQDSE
jgi:glycosyltransferase involved in cell wall biosynthesis